MLKTDYKDDIFEGNRQYTIVTSGGKSEIVEVTEMKQEGDVFGAKELNEIGKEFNALADEVAATKKSVSDGKIAIAAAITLKKVATAATDTFAQMAANIKKIKLGSGNAKKDDVRAGMTFTNDDGVELTGTLVERGSPTYDMPINGTINLDSGIYSGGTVSQKIPTLSKQTITPKASQQTVAAANKFLTGDIIIKGDSKLTGANIVKGNSIFGVAGTRNYIDKIGTNYNFDGYNMSSSKTTESVISINTPETANYPYILMWWGCGGGGYFPLGGAGSTTDRMYLQFTSSLYYKIYMTRPTLTSVEVHFLKVAGSGYGICNAANVKVCAGSNVSFS